MVIEVEALKKRGKPKKSGNGSKPLTMGLKKQMEPKPYIVIDHPANGEKIHPNHYTIRIGAGGGENVHISIDEGDWKPCRPSHGYYWFDWHSIEPGEHKVVAKMTLVTGNQKKSKATLCKVG